MDHQIDAKFERAIKGMSELPLTLEKLFSKGNEIESSRSKALPRSNRRRPMREAFSEPDFAFQPWILVRAA